MRCCLYLLNSLFVGLRPKRPLKFCNSPPVTPIFFNAGGASVNIARQGVGSTISASGSVSIAGSVEGGVCCFECLESVSFLTGCEEKRGTARATRPTAAMSRLATIVCDFVFRFSETGSADVTAWDAGTSSSFAWSVLIEAPVCTP